MVKLSALRTDRRLPGNIHYSHLSEVGSTPGPQCGGMIKSIKNLSDPIGNQTRWE